MDQRPDPTEGSRGIDRRTFLKYGAFTGGAVAASQALPGLTGSAGAAAANGGVRAISSATRTAAKARRPKSFEFEEKTIAELQSMMESGETTSRQLTQAYIHRIDEIDQNGIH